MAKSFHFAKKIQVLDNKINLCMNDIANLFTEIETPSKQSSLENTDKVFREALCEMLQKLLPAHGCYEYTKNADYINAINYVRTKIILEKTDFFVAMGIYIRIQQDSALSLTPGVAEFILPHLGELRKQNTLSLLEDLCYDFKKIHETSLSPEENLTDKIHLLWQKICYQLENYLIQLLQVNHVPLHSGYNHYNLNLLKKFVHSLQDMYIPDLVWTKYQNHRCSYLENYNCMCSVVGSCLNCCLKLTIQCIYEDEFLIFIGCFHPYTVTQSNVFETYFEVIDKKFYSTLKILERCFTVRKDLPEEITSVSRPTNLTHIKNCLCCFMQNQIKSEVDSAVYCIQNNYGINSVWNTVFINSVVKIVETILVFEDKINVLFRNKETTYHVHSDDLLTLIEGTKLVLATESPEASPISKPLHPISSKKQLCVMENEKIFLIWSWRLAIVENRSLIRLQRSLQNDAEGILKKFIEIEKRKLKSGQWKELLPTLEETYFISETVQTNTLLQSVFSTVQNLEKFLPVLATRCESFLSFRSSFEHTLETYVINLIRHLKDIAGYSYSNFTIYYEYIAINNAIFLKNRLENYCGILKDSAFENQKNNILHSITQLTKDLTDSVYLHHYRYISCGILFDADSNKFDDPKQFFEGERISYSIQMWYLHMKGLLHDLSYFLPQKVAKEQYVKILSSSLEHFLARYSHATPSEARTSQVMYDLNALLLCASELLWPACSSVSQFIGRKHGMDEGPLTSTINKIHSSCCYLLAVLVVLTAPLPELHKAFKDGFPQAQLSIRTKYESVAPWLPWIRRELFSEFCNRQIVSNISVWLAVKACTYWCLPNPMTVVKAFTEHNCTLSILLMMQAASISSMENENPPNLLEGDKIKLAYSLFELLICYGNHCHLQGILLPVIEKTNGWQEFNVETTVKASTERSWWYTALVETLKQYYTSIFEEMIPVWFEVSKKYEDGAAMNAFTDIKISFINHVVCVCEKDPLNSYTEEFEMSDEVVSYVCVKKFLESMQRHIASLSQTLKCFLLSLNLHITNYVPEIQSVRQSLPLQILLSSAIDFLRGPGIENKISKDLKGITDLTATALETLLLKTEFVFINDNCTKSLTMLLSSLHESFNDFKKYIERQSETMHSKEIEAETLEITVYKLLQLSNGNDIILYLHRLLCQNESWIQKSLGVPGMLSKDIVVDPPSPSPLMVNNPEFKEGDHKERDLSSFSDQKLPSREYIDPVQSGQPKKDVGHGYQQPVGNYFSNFSPSEYQDSMGRLNLEVIDEIPKMKFHFNPINCFDQLGESNFTQFVLEKYPFRWESILSHLPILGLTEVNFCTILSRRWDIRNEGPLTDEEQKFVEHIRTVYQIT